MNYGLEEALVILYLIVVIFLPLSYLWLCK